MRSSIVLFVASTFTSFATAAALPPHTPWAPSFLVPKAPPPPFAASCDLSKATFPAGTAPLPAPTGKLALVAIGRGTQNYTCADATAASIPVSVGAVATLYNASCYAASQPQMLASLPAAALAVNSPAQFGPRVQNFLNLFLVGQHFFQAANQPIFHLSGGNNGFAMFKKTFNETAPANTRGDVPWLQLATVESYAGSLTQVYRLQTAGGSAPATCAGVSSLKIEVQYAAEYWFYQS